MRAAVLHGKQDVRVEVVDVPLLEPGEVLIRTQVALTCGTDLKVYRRGYHARMIVPPALFGHEAAGSIEMVGEGVTGWAPGDRVVAANSAPCGECEFCREHRPGLCDDLLFWNGAYAQFTRLPARVVCKNLLRIPEGLSFARAAMVEPLACVVRGIEAADLGPGRSVAVIGVGGIGLMFIALARARGCYVVAAGRRPARLAMAREMGAAATVSAEAGGLVSQLLPLSPDERGFHLVVEAAGQAETAEAALRVVRKGGMVNFFAGCPAGTEIRVDAPRVHYEELQLTATFHHTPESVRSALALIAEGQIDPDRFISTRGPLDRLPSLLAEMTQGSDDLKAAVLPWE
jgi:L-iditol 2-dehydrogenase